LRHAMEVFDKSAYILATVRDLAHCTKDEKSFKINAGSV